MSDRLRQVSASSTTRMEGPFGFMRASPQWRGDEAHREGAPLSDGAGHFQATLVFFEDGARHGEPQAESARFCRKQWLHDLAKVSRRDAHVRIRDGNLN